MSIQIFFAKISSLTDSNFNDFMKLVSKEHQERLVKLRLNINRKLSLYSELLVRHQICMCIPISNREIIFEKNENGKPFLQDHSEFQFNISHTRNAIAVAISGELIGIDIEKIRNTDLKIAKRFFTTLECEYIINNTDKSKAFYEIWTKKEAYIKYMGKGLSIPLGSFDVLDLQISSRINTFQINDYIISVCSEKSGTKFVIFELSEDQITEMALSKLL